MLNKELVARKPEQAYEQCYLWTRYAPGRTDYYGFEVIVSRCWESARKNLVSRLSPTVRGFWLKLTENIRERVTPWTQMPYAELA